ncbi:ATP synthase alpha/beta family, nucleotide-binding domain protein, partial [Chlamydia psittaci 06-1683]
SGYFISSGCLLWSF